VLEWRPLTGGPLATMQVLDDAYKRLVGLGISRPIFRASPIRSTRTVLQIYLTQKKLPDLQHPTEWTDLDVLEQRSFINITKIEPSLRNFSLTRQGSNYFTDQHVAGEFVRTAVQYYILGRYGLLSMMAPVPPVLLHHALEMILKVPYAASGLDDKALKSRFGHDINSLWANFKNDVAGDASLDTFDWIASELAQWESIRYPKPGSYMISYGIGVPFRIMPAVTSLGAVPSFTANSHYVDQMFAAVMKQLGVTKNQLDTILVRAEARNMYAQANQFSMI
jgi:hypothetical protein